MSTREQGQSTAVYIVVQNNGTDEVEILKGQSGLSETFTNNLEEVTGLKEAGVESDDQVTYVQRSDSTRDITWSIETVALEDATDAAIQAELLNKLKHKKDTTTIIFVGGTTKVGGNDSVNTMLFKGTQYTALVGSVNNSFPYGSDVTGTIELSNKGTVKPIEHDGTETFAAILASLTNSGASTQSVLD